MIRLFLYLACSINKSEICIRNLAYVIDYTDETYVLMRKIARVYGTVLYSDRYVDI